MADQADDAEKSSIPADNGELVHAKAERLDRPRDPNGVVPAGSAPPAQVASLRKQLVRYRVAAAGAVVLVIFLITVIVSLSGASTGDSLPPGAATPTTVTSTASSSPVTTRATPAPTTTVSTAAPATTPPPATTAAAPPAIPAPPVYLNGQDDLSEGRHFNLDDGDEWLSSAYGDIVHDGVAISGVSGAVLALGMAGSDEYSRCGLVVPNAYRSHIPFAEFANNNILCVRTTEGRLAYLELTSIPDGNGRQRFSFRWTTWKK
jgi:hypothetical protein